MVKTPPNSVKMSKALTKHYAKLSPIERSHAIKAENFEIVASRAGDKAKNRSDKMSAMIDQANIERYRAGLIKGPIKNK
jgi:hypothetical protein